MIKVKNKKTIRKLAIRSFYSSKTRNIITAIAIALTALLFTSLFALGSGMVKSMKLADIILSGGEGHARLEHMTEQQYQTISSHPLIKENAYCRKLADKIDNDELIKRNTEFLYYDNLGLKFTYTEPTSGHTPMKENEVITDTTTLDMLHIPHQVGSHLSLKLTIHGEKISRDFILAGWWKSYPGVQTGTIIASKAYINAHLNELSNTYYKDHSEAGCITDIIKFADSKNISENLKKVVTDCGFSMDFNDKNYISTGINPLYLSQKSSVSFATIAALCCALILFIFTGYLIIYNIFQISIINNIHFYGLLKTIGTTGHQIYSVINWQVLILSLMGIPFGLCGGFFIGKALLPVLLAQSTLQGNAVITSPNPLIFVAAIIFTLITVFISIRKPARMAVKVSPIEAVRYTDATLKNNKKAKNTQNGSLEKRMAWDNLGRNKKRTILVILSLSLSIVLTNTVFNFSQSVDPEKALKNTYSSDFTIGKSSLLFQCKINAESALNNSVISTIKKQPGFKAGGCQYGCKAEYKSKTTKQTCNNTPDGSFSTHIYGMDKLLLSHLKLIDGKLDANKLATGKYILEGVWVNSRGEMDMTSLNNSVGDTITLNIDGKTQNVTVLGHVIANESNTYDWVSSCFFLPEDVYKKITGKNYVMSYMFDVTKDKETAMEQFLKTYTSDTDQTMSYKSKFTTLSGVMNIRNTVISIGGTISLIIGIIGILNFVNTILTNIIVRRREFAILQSIGMTRKQLVRMLCLEGSFYTLLTVVISVILSITSSIIIVRPICHKIWFLNFKFNFWPLIIIFPLLIILGCLIPYISYKYINKQSIVERLRIE
ncbi:ABC transporter permease [Inconstantimicrobium porci]|uniref:ABC transporter permease n=1 Tax=Inconstantimicrobium porci TaxID=2652291 RepID=A0A7X2T2C7_9CLOT|nr:ABC transporter permease [Inconstantimicrobium porci]MSR92522.1 ABC transporter permease [Inconstantimicrobium porci]